MIWCVYIMITHTNIYIYIVLTLPRQTSVACWKWKTEQPCHSHDPYTYLRGSGKCGEDCPADFAGTSQCKRGDALLSFYLSVRKVEALTQVLYTAAWSLIFGPFWRCMQSQGTIVPLRTLCSQCKNENPPQPYIPVSSCESSTLKPFCQCSL